jgi:hemoglobin
MIDNFTPQAGRESMNDLYSQLGGRESVLELVECFYDIMERTEPELTAVHELSAPGKVSRRNRDRFGSFLLGWLGGPDDYVRQNGHPRLRMRHARVVVNMPSATPGCVACTPQWRSGKSPNQSRASCANASQKSPTSCATSRKADSRGVAHEAA